MYSNSSCYFSGLQISIESSESSIPVRAIGNAFRVDKVAALVRTATLLESQNSKTQQRQPNWKSAAYT